MIKAPKTPQFRLCHNRGFQITFENGYTVSVQFGAGNYCDNRTDALDAIAIKSDTDLECRNAEVAIIDHNNNFVEFSSSGESVLGEIDPNKVAEMIAWASLQKPKFDTPQVKDSSLV